MRLKLPTEKIIAEKADGIGWITFNQPEKRNAMSVEMWEGVSIAADDYAADPAVRVVVMKGAGGKAFVSGADISQFEKVRANADAQKEYDRLTSTGRKKLNAIDKPLIAMIQGFCMGGGLGIAMSADMRFCSDDSQFAIPAAKLSIAYAFESLKRLVELVGPAMAKEILFTARRLSAAEAQAIGLVNRTVPVDKLEATVRDVCAAIVENAPLSIRASKFTINDVLKDPSEREPAKVAELARACFDSNDYKEGRTAFMEKRKPAFTGT
ncbi:MAG: enoyl-CoA hydratase/isomerase family protein [Alphaproteobacteria bacterium]|nr:enoyl-CoA hydratase/isomerase family protein [Alphaproteobacteria bacterium]